MADIIDLTLEDDDFGPGRFVAPNIRITQSSNAPKDTNKITFGQIMEGKGKLKCFCSAYVADLGWLLSFVKQIPDVCVSLDRNAVEGKPSSCSNMSLVYPDFPKFPAYGVMHAKVILIFYRDWLRLVISSGNLMDHDYDQVQNVNRVLSPNSI